MTDFPSRQRSVVLSAHRAESKTAVEMSLSYLLQESTALHPDSIWALSYTPTHLISGSSDGHLRIFDPSSLAEPLHDIASHPLAITSLSSTSDGKYALGTSLDGTVVLVDVINGAVIGKVETGREKAAEGEKELPGYAAAIHPNGECWGWSGRSSKLGIRRITDLASGHEDGEANGNGNGNGIGRGALAGTGAVVDTGKGKFGMDVKFSPDGQSVAVSTEAGQIVVVDTETQGVVATYASHAMAVRSISWSPDSQWLYSGADDQRIVLHDVRAGSKTGAGGKGEGAVAILQGHQSWVLKVAASPDAKLLGSGGADKMIKLWDVGQRACVSTNTTTAEVWGMEWQPSGADSFAVGKQFAVAGDDRAVSIYRAAGSL